MRRPLDPARLRAVLDALGRACRGPGTACLTGGATALLEGWRSATVDLDLKLDPEPEGVFAAITSIKEQIEVNVELASPDQFLPELADWRERSPLVGRFGVLEVRHYDLRAQSLAKLARGFDRDVADVRAMLERYPRISERDLEQRLAQLCPHATGSR